MAESEVDATLLFSCNEVSWFKIEDGVQKLLLTGKLEAAMVMQHGQAILMLNVGSSWVHEHSKRYALTKNLPSMKAGQKQFLFPGESGYLGLTFGKTVADSKIKAFENLLQNFSAYSEAQDVLSQQDIAKDTNTKVAESADTGLAYVQKGTNVVTESIDTVSKATSKGIKWATKMIKKRIKPNEKPLEVSDNVKWQSEKLRQMGGVAVTFSKSMVTGAVATASQLSNAVYENAHGTSQGAKLEKAMEDPKAQAAAKVAIVSAGAAWEIYLAMAQAGVQFVQDIADASADVVEHKYGEDAGLAARNAMSAATQGVQALNIVNNAPYTAVAEGIMVKQRDAVVDGTGTKVKMDQKAIEPAKPAQQAILADDLD